MYTCISFNFHPVPSFNLFFKQLTPEIIFKDIIHYINVFFDTFPNKKGYPTIKLE